MGLTTLVERDIEVGKKALEALDSEGVDVRSALWLFQPDLGWKFVLASPAFSSRGPIATYELVRRAFARRHVDLPLSSVTLMSTSEDLPKSLRHIVRTGRREIQNLRFSRNRIGDTFIDDAWVYRSA
jgi:hypothetical protein